MIHDKDFDFYVADGVLVEVQRGEKISAAQQFGVDWDGPMHSMINASVFSPPPDALAAPSHDPLPRTPWRVLAWRALSRFWIIWLVYGALTVAFLAWGRARGWW